jgi:hypothetical protein
LLDLGVVLRPGLPAAETHDRDDRSSGGKGRALQRLHNAVPPEPAAARARLAAGERLEIDEGGSNRDLVRFGPIEETG